jgi:exodeoxyribonuclease V alpha subunit
MSEKKKFEDSIEGILEHFVFRNEENGYSIIRIKPFDSIREIVATGILIGVDIGEKLILRGDWIFHPEYGQQFRLKSYQVEQPVTKDGICKFLSSSLIKGIGPKTAGKIVETFGDRSLDIIENEPEKLETVEGIGKTKRKIIEDGWAEKKGIKNIMLFLQKYNLKTALALKIYKTYGDEAFQVLRTNPYRLTEDIYGIGFKTADSIAASLGIERTSLPRIESALHYLLRQFADEGHCYAPEKDILSDCAELLGVDHILIENVLRQMLARKALLSRKDAVYHPLYYYAEIQAAEKLLRILRSKEAGLSYFRNVDWKVVFSWLFEKHNIQYSPKQMQGVTACLANKVTILTGGPGTGKSTITKALTTILEAKKYKFLLTAPTGRAAKRLSEVTGQPAQTIHRLLEFSWQNELRFRRNEDNPLDASLIIMDEASMLDLLIFNHFLKAVRHDTHLILIGDIDQLPSVGAGYVLNDLIASNQIPTVRLNEIFRQKNDSSIITNTHRIREGIIPLFSKNRGDFFFFNAETPAKATALIVELVKERIPRTFGHDKAGKIQVLAPLHKGEAGISALNRQLQNVLNPHSARKTEITTGEKIYREADRIIQLKNNYEKEVFNGDLGSIEEIDRENQIIKILYDNRIVEYEFYEIDQITHSYAISIHKSQGSEFPVVVIPILMQHYIMLQRNLLYTGVSRAKEIVVLVGNLQAVETALRNNRITRRNTMLTEILRGENVS